MAISPLLSEWRPMLMTMNCVEKWWIITWVRETLAAILCHQYSSQWSTRKWGDLLSYDPVANSSRWPKLCLNSRANQVARLLHSKQGYSPNVCVSVTQCLCLQEMWKNVFRFVSPHGLLRVSCFRRTTPWGSSLTGSFLSPWSVKASLQSAWVFGLICLISQSLDLSSCSTSCWGSWASESISGP